MARKIGEISFSNLMAVYEESNQHNGKEKWPEESPALQLLLAEQGFHQYLRECFFTTAGAVYAIWQQDGLYVSALRLEPYQDGLLLEALETVPDGRRKGHAKALIRSVRSMYPDDKIYAHVSKRNIASLRTHESCGFRKILDHAVFIDGSVMQSFVTLVL